MQPCPYYRAVLERCSSGLRGTPGKRVYSKRVSGVRISFSPQTEKENQRQVHLNADFLFPVCTAPPQAAGDVGAPANEIPERRRRAGPPTGDVGAPADEISKRRRCAEPPTGDDEASATKSRREGGAQDHMREMSERQRTKSRREGGAQNRLREMSEHQRTKSQREGGAQDRLRTRPVISDDDLLNHRR